MPSVHRPVVLLYVPVAVVALTNVSVGGSTSRTTTPFAVPGPLFTKVRVNVSVSPGRTAGLLEVLVSSKSACGATLEHVGGAVTVTGVLVHVAEVLSVRVSVRFPPAIGKAALAALVAP